MRFKFLLTAVALCVASAGYAAEADRLLKPTVELEAGEKCIPKYLVNSYNYIYRTQYDDNECYEQLTQDAAAKARSDAMEDTYTPYPYYFPVPSYLAPTQRYIYVPAYIPPFVYKGRRY